MMGYQSRFEGIDNSYLFELTLPEDQFEPFYAELAKRKHDSVAKVPTEDRITRDFRSSMLEVKVDRIAKTMTVQWVNY